MQTRSVERPVRFRCPSDGQQGSEAEQTMTGIKNKFCIERMVFPCEAKGGQECGTDQDYRAAGVDLVRQDRV